MEGRTLEKPLYLPDLMAKDFSERKGESALKDKSRNDAQFLDQISHRPSPGFSVQQEQPACSGIKAACCLYCALRSRLGHHLTLCLLHSR